MKAMSATARRLAVAASSTAFVAWGFAATPALGAGAAYSWGSNAQGVLGIGWAPWQVSQRAAPSAIVGLSSGVTALGAGERHGMAIQDGALYAWGYNEAGEVGDGNSGVNASVFSAVPVPSMSSGVTAIAGGGYFSLAVRNGAAYGWGYNVYGQIGNGTIDPSFQVHPIPTPIVGLSSGVTRLDAGFGHALAIQNGTVVAWGDNKYGQLGRLHTERSGTPEPVYGLPGGVTDIAAGAFHSLALAGGAVYTWGENSNGVLGNTDAPYAPYASVVPELSSGVTDIAAGSSFNLAVQDGRVVVWGSNRWGQYGNGEMAFFGDPTPRLVPGITGTITQVAATSGSAFALASDGSLWVWGQNSNAQLGLGFTSDFVGIPTQLFAPAGFRFESITGGSTFAYAMVVPAALPGDYNGDGFVDAADYTVWADHFGQTGSGIQGDGNNDGVVDAADYTVWADHFGQGTPPAAAIPEPAAVAALGLPLLGLTRRRR